MRYFLTRSRFSLWTLIVPMAFCVFAPSRLLAQKAVGRKAGEERSDNKLKMKFCWCPKGKFRMGSPITEPTRYPNESQIDVTLSSGFWMGKYEVTQSQYRAVMGKNPSRFIGDSFPAERVNWTDATEFCKKLTELEQAAGRLPKGWEYRLPTEAQWEYACRAGTTTAFSFGNDVKQLAKYAWYYGKLDGSTIRVGQKKPNPWGLYDMHGNVAEWCRDWYSEKLPGGTNPEFTKPSFGRVFRGGGWSYTGSACRSAYRFGNLPAVRLYNLGFRVARVQTGG